MHEVGTLDVGRDGHVGAEGLQRAVRLAEAVRGPVAPHVGFVTEGPEGPDTDFRVRPRPQRGGEFGHVDTRSAVDLRRILPGQQIDSHWFNVTGSQC